MSELTLFLIRFAYLAVLWIFVLSALSVIRSDMFGARVPEAARANGGGNGRGTDAAIRLDDDYVSTRHARVAWSGSDWFVEDLGSTNGTYVGASRITEPTTIGLGVQVRVGKTILELRK